MKMVYSPTVVLALLLLVAIPFISSNAVTLTDCNKKIYVEDDVVIDAPISEDCFLEFETQTDRILVFTLIDGTYEEALKYVAIHDGLKSEDRILHLENQLKHEVTRKDAPQAIYTTSSVASVRFLKTPITQMKLRIAKAVNCPFNLGFESQCGRIIDDVSCYCATFTKRSQSSQTSYCTNNGMKLLALESYAEESAIVTTWGNEVSFWTSLTDYAREGEWIWGSTGKHLYPGYANWDINQPDNLNNEDCVVMNLNAQNFGKGWNDYPCSNTYDAICEHHP